MAPTPPASAQAQTKPALKREDAAPAPDAVVISFPFEASLAYAPRRMDGTLTPGQAATARCLLDGLIQRRAQLNDQHYVERPLDLFRWFLEEAHRRSPALRAAVAAALGVPAPAAGPSKPATMPARDDTQPV